MNYQAYWTTPLELPDWSDLSLAEIANKFVWSFVISITYSFIVVVEIHRFINVMGFYASYLSW